MESLTLTAGQTIPWDRHWAVTHEASKFDPANPQWVMCRNFMIGSQNPGVAGIWSNFDEITGQITLRHAAAGDITFTPGDAAGEAAFLAWVTPLYPADKRTPQALVSAAPRGLTDTPDPSVSIMNTASHQAVETYFGHPVSPERWRGNIWIDGFDAWAEETWVGKSLRIGTAELAVTDPCTRCMATVANPETGLRDLDTLGALRNGWDHQEFGVYATVTTSGDVRIGDKVRVI